MALVGAKFYLKSVQGLIRNLSKIPMGFGFVLGWVNPLFGIRFKAYLSLVENSKLASGLTLRCACSFLREDFRFFKSIYIYIQIVCFKVFFRVGLRGSL